MEDGILEPETFLVPEPEMQRLREYEDFSTKHHIKQIYEFLGECYVKRFKAVWPSPWRADGFTGSIDVS